MNSRAIAIGAVVLGLGAAIIAHHRHCTSTQSSHPGPTTGPITTGSPIKASARAPSESGGPTSPAPPPCEDYKSVLVEYGVNVPPSDDELLRLLRKLVDADDAHLRRLLGALFDALINIDTLQAKSMRVPSGKWDLPDTFGARLLALVLPMLDRTYSLNPPDEELKVLAMALEVLERMQYAPALRELMRPNGVHAFGELTRWTWPRFGRAAVEPLIARATDTSGAERQHALKMLGQIRDVSAVPDLQKLLESQDPQQRAAATEALREMGAAPSNDRMRSVAGNPTARFTERKEAMQTLISSGSTEDLDFVLGLIDKTVSQSKGSSRDMDVACTALAALLEHGDSRAIEWAVAFVQRKTVDEAVRQMRNETISSLGTYRVASSEPALLSIVDDETDDLIARKRAASALGRLDPSKAEQYYQKSRDFDERWQEQQKRR